MRSRIDQKPETTSQRHGAVLALVAVSLAIILGIVAIALDGGLLLDARRRVQAAADAAVDAAVEAAVEEAVPAEVLAASLFVRFRSRQDHTFAEKVLSAMRFGFGGHVEPPKK